MLRLLKANIIKSNVIEVACSTPVLKKEAVQHVGAFRKYVDMTLPFLSPTSDVEHYLLFPTDP